MIMRTRRMVPQLCLIGLKKVWTFVTIVYNNNVK